MTEKTEKRLRGFQLMTPERRREVASMGGKEAQFLGVGHQWNTQEAREAGCKGGRKSSERRREREQTT